MDIKYMWKDRRYLISRRWEHFIIWFSRRLPKCLVKWSFYRIMADVTTGKYSDTTVPELTAIDAIDRWCKDNGCS